MATVQSLVEYHSFVIDQTSFVHTIDKVFIKGNFYSDKPPMPAILGAAAYWPLYHLGIRLHEGTSFAYFLITLMTVKALWLIGTIAFYKLLRFTELDEGKRFLAALALGVGSLFFTWSSTFNNHEFAGAFLSIGLYFFLTARHEVRTARNLGLAGLFFSLAGTADMPTGIFYALFLAYVVCNGRLRPATVFYVVPLLATLLPTLAVNYAIHGSVLPVQMVRSYFEYPGSYWLDSAEKLSGMGVNGLGFTMKYALRALLGPNGFLIYNPFSLIALWGLIRELRPKSPFFYEALIVCSGGLGLAAYYLLTTSNYGGWSYSMRWLVPLLPILFFFLFPYFVSYHDAHPNIFRSVLCVSMIIAIVGLINPWCNPADHGGFISNILQARGH
jgi:hypothetical protein